MITGFRRHGQFQRSFFPAPAVYPNIVEARAGNQFERDASDLKVFLPNLEDFFPRGKVRHGAPERAGSPPI
jgi:hypothetical protein